MAEQRLIDAKALWKNIDKLPSVLDANNGWLVKKTSVLAKIEDATVVQPKPVVHAHWEECNWIEYGGSGECIRCPKSGLRCSNCNNVFKKELLWKENYCPNCGAQMDEDIEHTKGNRMD